MPRTLIIAACGIVGLATCISANAATLGPVPTVVPPGDDYLAPTTNLGVSGQFWLITYIEWDQTGEVSIEVPVITPPDDPGAPVLHNIFMTVKNGTADHWNRFEIEVSGPATLTDLIPPTINLASDPPELTPSTLDYSGLDWEPDSFTPTIAFNLNVTPPIDNEPVVFTFRPIATLPEPGSAAILAIGAGLVCRRRHRRA